MKKRRRKKKLPMAAEAVKRTGSAMANATRGRARTFQDRKKQAARDACRKRGNDE